MTGSLAYAAGESSELMTVTAAGVPTTTAMIRAKGLEYTKVGDGPWLKSLVPPPAGSDLWAYLRSLSGVADRGIEEHDGGIAHRIEPPATTVLDATALGLAGAAASDSTPTVVFYADNEGRPLAMVVTMSWIQLVDGAATPATMTLHLTYAGPAGGVAVAAPEHVWSRFASGRFHFSVAYPDRWTADTSDRYDDFLNGPGVTHIGARRMKAEGRSLGAWTKSIYAIHRDSPKDYVLLGNDATTLAGEDARMLTSTYHDYGQRLICFEVVALHAAHVYDIFWVSPVKTRDAGLATFRQVLATYAYP